MYFCYFKLETREREQKDMNPDRQRDVRVRDVDVNRQSDEPVVFV